MHGPIAEPAQAPARVRNPPISTRRVSAWRAILPRITPSLNRPFRWVTVVVRPGVCRPATSCVGPPTEVSSSGTAYSNQMRSPHFLHSNRRKAVPCVGINNQSDESELATAETTGLVGLVADSGKPRSPKQVHDADPDQLRSGLFGLRRQFVPWVMNLWQLAGGPYDSGLTLGYWLFRRALPAA
jgi:hypothetical protein